MDKLQKENDSLEKTEEEIKEGNHYKSVTGEEYEVLFIGEKPEIGLGRFLSFFNLKNKDGGIGFFKSEEEFRRILKEGEEEAESDSQKYLRALADYQNLLKQTAKDREEFVKYAASDFLQDILPVYDHLKMSLAGLSEEEAKSPWAIGVRHVLKQFKDILESRGVEEIKTVGEKFDHDLMEAIDGTGETVKQEIMPGYKLNGKVIRHAKVIVE